MSVASILVLALLLAAWLMMITRNLISLVHLAAVQGMLLALVAFLAGAELDERGLYVAATLTLLVKGLAIPTVLLRILRRIGPMRLPDIIFTTRTMAVLAFAVTGGGYYLAAPLLASASAGAGVDSLIPPALSLVLIGSLVVVCRRLALAQAVGLLVVENGLFLAAMGVAGGVPLVMDIAILAELLVAMLIMGALVHRMHGLMGSISTEKLRRLRG